MPPDLPLHPSDVGNATMFGHQSFRAPLRDATAARLCASAAVESDGLRPLEFGIDSVVQRPRGSGRATFCTSVDDTPEEDNRR